MSVIRDAAINGQQEHAASKFPFVFGCEDGSATLDQATEWVEQQRDDILELATKHGAVAFRGFPTPSVESFDEVVQRFSLENFPYKKSLSNAVRINRTERVFSANEAPPEVQIFFIMRWRRRHCIRDSSYFTARSRQNVAAQLRSAAATFSSRDWLSSAPNLQTAANDTD